MAINKIQIIILVLSLVDLTATYFYVSTFNTKFPNLDYTSLEANPILRMSWKQFGLAKGMIFGGILVFCIMLILVLAMTEKWQYFFLGILVMMCIYHLLNFSQLARLPGAPA